MRGLMQDVPLTVEMVLRRARRARTVVTATPDGPRVLPWAEVAERAARLRAAFAGLEAMDEKNVSIARPQPPLQLTYDFVEPHLTTGVVLTVADGRSWHRARYPCGGANLSGWGPAPAEQKASRVGRAGPPTTVRATRGGVLCLKAN